MFLLFCLATKGLLNKILLPVVEICCDPEGEADYGTNWIYHFLCEAVMNASRFVNTIRTIGMRATPCSDPKQNQLASDSNECELKVVWFVSFGQRVRIAKFDF